MPNKVVRKEIIARERKRPDRLLKTRTIQTANSIDDNLQVTMRALSLMEKDAVLAKEMRPNIRRAQDAMRGAFEHILSVGGLSPVQHAVVKRSLKLLKKDLTYETAFDIYRLTCSLKVKV